MSLISLIQAYGYTAVFFGAFLEGETILVMAGFAAHGGYLELPWVMGIAAAGSFLGDQFYYSLGRHYGPQMLRRFPRMKPRVTRVLELLKRHNMPLIFGIRFMYGLRTVAPVAIGMSGVRWARFCVIDLISALIWAIAIAGAGYLFGQALELVIAHLRRYEEAVLILIGVAGAAVWIIHRRRHRHIPR